MKIKKPLLILIALTILAGAALWFFKQIDKPDKINQQDLPLFKRQDSYLVRPIGKTKVLSGDLKDKALQPSLHGGKAVFIGPYRMELAIFGMNGQVANYGLYLDNSLAQPILPKDTEIYIQFEDKQILKFNALRSGLLSTLGPLPQLPQKFLIIGKFNNKKFSTTIEINNFRTKRITPRDME